MNIGAAFKVVKRVLGKNDAPPPRIDTLPAYVPGWRLFIVYHQSRGVGAHVIRLGHLGAWANHVSFFFAPTLATMTELLDSVLFEARNGKGVTGPGHEWARTLMQAIKGGDKVEVWMADVTALDTDRLAYEWAGEQRGKAYDAPGLAGFVPTTLTQRFAIKWQKARKQETVWWCSEIGQAVTAKRLLPALINVQPFQISPEWLRSSPRQSFVFGKPDNFPHVIT